MEFTQAQKQALEIRDKNILVSAAAGSGKTATLTERILRLIRDEGQDVNRMLIVTFTRAAASELRDRIGKKINEYLAANPGDRHLTDQLMALPGAPIKTIDAYYLEVVRANFQRLGLPAAFRTADASEASVLALNTMNDVTERMMATDPDFLRLGDSLCTVKTTEGLAKTLQSLYDRIRLMPEGTRILEESAAQYEEEAQRDFFASRAGRIVLRELSHSLKRMQDHLQEAQNILAGHGSTPKRTGNVEQTAGVLTQFSECLEGENYSALWELTGTLSLPSGIGGRKDDYAKDIDQHLKAISDTYKADIAKYFSSTPDTIARAQREHAVLSRALKRTLDAFTEAMTEEKNARGIVEFSDLPRYAVQLFLNEDGTPTETALAERERFSHIFVDEYQDTDFVQDRIFNIISNGHNLFFVGDIKQSIYNFRGAEPSLFAGYRRRYPQFEAGRDQNDVSIFMSDNFRCSQNIIDFTNTVCGRLFRMAEDDLHAGIGYVDGDDLIHGREPTPTEEKVKIRLFETQKEEAEEGTASPAEVNDEADEEQDDTPESRYVVEEIRRLIAAGHAPEEIAVLAEKNRDCMHFYNALSAAGIPVSNSTQKDLFENEEVLLMLSLLTAVDNPQRDVPLAGALRSAIFGFTLTDLVNLRLGRTSMSLFDALCEYGTDAESPDAPLAAKARAAVERLSTLRDMAEAMPIRRFIRAVWKECDAPALSGQNEASATLAPNERRRNLLMFYDFARNFEGSSFHGLHDFIDYINGMIEKGESIDLSPEKSAGSVSVMTVHKSKGLEFPIVFLVSTSKSLSKKAVPPSAVFTREEGIGLASRVSDESGLYSVETPIFTTAMDLCDAVTLEEKIRILYVALTRAKNMLYITAYRSQRKGAKDGALDALGASAAKMAEENTREALMFAPSYIKWILASLGDRAEWERFCDTEKYVNSLPENDGAASALAETTTAPATEPDLTAELERRFAYEYPYGKFTSIPAKLSVSRLYPDVLTEEESFEDEAAKMADALEKAEAMEPRVPRFMGGESGAAEKGTATHLFLQFCDFSALDGTEEAVRREAERLCALGFLTPEVSGLVRSSELARFSSSAFFKAIRTSPKVWRETRFNIFLPASDFTTDPALKAVFAEEKLMVQGVIDLFFLDNAGRLILCDYKTDRLSREELRDPELARERMRRTHAEQLGYYAAAIEQMTGRRPDRTVIYSLHLGAALDLDL